MFILKLTGLLCLGLLKFAAVLVAGTARKAWQLLRWLLRRRSRTFGSAHWASFFATCRAGVLGGNGFIVGKRWFRFVRQNLEGYALIFAATRTGKTALLGANLLEYAGSAIVNDPKGELRAVTGRSRQARGPVADAARPRAVVQGHGGKRRGTFHDLQRRQGGGGVRRRPAGRHGDARQ